MAVKALCHVMVSRDDYAEFRRLCTDGGLLPGRYEDFVDAVDQLLGSSADKRVPVRKVWTTPAEFAAWCRREGKPVDAKGRAAFAAYHVATDRD